MVTLMFAQVYFSIISFTDGSASMPLNIGMMTFILASMYSFFGYPVEIAAVNALQSNASQGALLAAAGSQIFMQGAGTPFVFLSALMMIDFIGSMTVYFSHNQSQLARSITSSTGVQLVDPKNDEDDDFHR